MVNNLISSIITRLRIEQIDIDWFSNKRILVTGGAGFIGSWLVEALVELDAQVYVVDNLWRGSLENLRGDKENYSIPLENHFFLSDLRDPASVKEVIERSKPDLIFHLADIVAGIDYVFANEHFLFNANMLINSNLFMAASEAKIEKLIYVGTACSYPKSLQSTLGSLPLTEDLMYPADPESAYGWSKLMGEYEADLFAKNTGKDVGILRLHNVYGPRSVLSKKRSQVIPSLIRKAVRFPGEDFIVWGSGKQTRDFVYVGDVIDALLRLPLKGMNKGVIQIGTARETSIAELAETIVKASGKNIPVFFDNTKPEGDRGRSGSYEKAREVIGWDVFTSIEEGIQQTYEWAYKQIIEIGIDLDD